MGFGRASMTSDTIPVPSISDLIWGAQIGTYELHVGQNLLLWSPEQMRVYGVDHAPTSAAEFYRLIHPDDRARVEAESNAFAASSEDSYSHSFRIQRPDGSVRVILDRGLIQRTSTGQIVLIRGVNIDVTNEAHLNYAAEARLHASEQRYRKLFDAIDEGFCIVEVRLDAPDGRVDYRVIEANPAFYGRTGFPKDILKAWLRTAAPELEDHWFDAYGKIARTGQPMRFENRSVFLGRWFDVYAFPIDDPKDCHVAILFNDITNRKHEEEQARLLVEEINHRSKNTLGVVQAIARQTANGGEENFLERFGERVRALAASHDLLVRNSWVTVGLCELVRTQLAPFADLFGNRINAGGPLVSLTPVATKALGMAFHELATNSAKYGALSNSTGTITITWAVEDGTVENRRLTLLWQERGGPPVGAPARLGFGTNVITRMAEASTGGSVALDYPPEGLEWRFACPAKSILADPADAGPLTASDPPA